MIFLELLFLWAKKIIVTIRNISENQPQNLGRRFKVYEEKKDSINFIFDFHFFWKQCYGNKRRGYS